MTSDNLKKEIEDLKKRIKELELKLREHSDIFNRMLESDLIRKETCKSFRREIEELNEIKPT